MIGQKGFGESGEAHSQEADCRRGVADGVRLKKEAVEEMVVLGAKGIGLIP